MPVGKEVHVKSDEIDIDWVVNEIMEDRMFGFFLVDIHVPDELWYRFQEFPPIFVNSQVSEEKIPDYMKKYRDETGRIKGGNKLLSVLKAEQVLLYSPLIKWYVNHGLVITKVYEFLKYKPGKPFKWFPDVVAAKRREADKDKANKGHQGATAKLLANSFYGKMIENLERHEDVSFTMSDSQFAKAQRDPFFLEHTEIGVGYEIRKKKKRIYIDRAYQVGIAVYQLAKLRMLEFKYDFLDNFVCDHDYELIQMDTDSLYFAISGKSLEDVVYPQCKERFERIKAQWIAEPGDDYNKFTPGLFKQECKGRRMIALCSKCYLVELNDGSTKTSAKGIDKRQNELTWERYKNALIGNDDYATNTGFRKEQGAIVTYSQKKKGLSAYYDKRWVLEDWIHTYPIM